MVKVEIYQLPFTEGLKTKIFCSWKDNAESFDFTEYKHIYSKYYLEETNDILEDIFREFNIDQPKDFRGHSLSVSDIVKLDDKYYYCDLIGWENVTERI